MSIVAEEIKTILSRNAWNTTTAKLLLATLCERALSFEMLQVIQKYLEKNAAFWDFFWFHARVLPTHEFWTIGEDRCEKTTASLKDSFENMYLECDPGSDDEKVVSSLVYQVVDVFLEHAQPKMGEEEEQEVILVQVELTPFHSCEDDEFIASSPKKAIPEKKMSRDLKGLLDDKLRYKKYWRKPHQPQDDLNPRARKARKTTPYFKEEEAE